MAGRAKEYPIIDMQIMLQPPPPPPVRAGHICLSAGPHADLVLCRALGEGLPGNSRAAPPSFAIYINICAVRRSPPNVRPRRTVRFVPFPRNYCVVARDDNNLGRARRTRHATLSRAFAEPVHTHTAYNYNTHAHTRTLALLPAIY